MVRQPEPTVRNTSTADTIGTVVQVGVVKGGISVHHPHPLPVPRNLPPRTPTFTDRHDDLARICADTIGTPPVLVVDGMPGVGKSALVVHAAHELAQRYPDGQVYLDMRGYTAGQSPLSTGEALGILLETLHVPPRTIPRSLEARVALWRSLLAPRKLLIVLDNVVRFADARPLLPGTGMSRCLVTSRRRIGVADGVTTLSLRTLPVREAADLFAKCAGLPPTPAIRPDTLHLVRNCGHLPLAITIAAAWLRKHSAWSVAELDTKLTDAVAVLGLQEEDAHVATAFQLSYRDLTPPAQELFRALALHPGPDISAHSAAALRSLDHATAQRLLDHLFDRHLLEEHRPGRYRMHDLVREFARELGREHDDEADRALSVRRLLEDLFRRAQAAARLIPTPISTPRDDTPEDDGRRHAEPTDYSSAIQWFRSELPNLVSCVRYASAHDVKPYAWSIVAEIGHVLCICGDSEEVPAIHTAAIEAAEAHGELSAQRGMLLNLGTVHLQQGDYPAARAALTRALRISSDAHDQRGIALSFTYLGGASQQEGNYADASAHLERARRIFVELGDLHGEAEALGRIGVVHLQQGERTAALASLQRAFALFAQVGDQRGVAGALVHIGVVHYRLTGDVPAALRHLGEALLVNRELGDRYDEAWTRSGIGIAHRVAGEPEEALTHLDQALRSHREIGDRQGEATALVHLGAVQRQLGNADVARELLEEALDLARAIGNRREEANALAEMGEPGPGE